VVLTAIPIYPMVAMDLPKWVLKAIGRKDEASCGRVANGGNCLVSWEKVERPIRFGGLGIHKLETLGWSLCIRWLWAQKTDKEHLWGGLPVQVPRIAEHAPNLIKIIPKRALKQCTVAQALQNRSWVADIKGAMKIEVCWNTWKAGT